MCNLLFLRRSCEYRHAAVACRSVRNAIWRVCSQGALGTWRELRLGWKAKGRTVAMELLRALIEPVSEPDISDGGHINFRRLCDGDQVVKRCRSARDGIPGICATQGYRGVEQLPHRRQTGHSCAEPTTRMTRCGSRLARCCGAQRPKARNRRRRLPMHWVKPERNCSLGALSAGFTGTLV